MDNWGLVAAAALLVAAVAGVAYAVTRQRETSALRDGVQLATDLRAIAGGDAVRIAAVDEYETSLYERLFYAAVVGPRLRSGVWALLGAVPAGAIAVLLDGRHGTVATIAFIASLVLLTVFVLTALAYFAGAAFAAATTPRVSFADSYGAELDEASADDEA